MIGCPSGSVLPEPSKTTNASGATVGGYQAVAESGDKVKTFSIFSDFTEVAPDNILGLYVADYAQGVVRIVKGVQNGEIPASNVEFGLKDEDVMKFTFRDGASASVPDDVRQEVEAVKAKIAAGEIVTRNK